MNVRPEGSDIELPVVRGGKDVRAKELISSHNLGVSACALVMSVLLGAQGLLYWSFRDRSPEPQLHAEAAAFLRSQRIVSSSVSRTKREAARREPIYLVPWYATEAREYLGDLYPQAIRFPERDGLESKVGVWIYGLWGKEKDLYSELRRLGFERVTQKSFSGVITVEYWRQSSQKYQVKWNALEQIKSAVVTIKSPGERDIHCRRWLASKKRWICPRDSSWQYVGVEWHRMGEATRECIWAHPPKNGYLQISFPETPVGDRLHINGGHTLRASTRAKASVLLKAQMGEQPDEAVDFAIKDTWKSVAVNASLSVSTATLSFSVSSSDNGANHFCFTAEVWTEL